jgi:hypothetical protein
VKELSLLLLREASASGLNINGARGKARMSNAIFATTYLSSVFS